jgi:hypothetical protein
MMNVDARDFRPWTSFTSDSIRPWRHDCSITVEMACVSGSYNKRGTALQRQLCGFDH